LGKEGWEPDDIMTREGGSRASREAAETQLYTFAEGTLKELIALELDELGLKDSSLQLFCRMDISIIDNDRGGLDYFVNEVERGPLVALYGGGPCHHAARVGDELGELLPLWLDKRFSE
jgi:hypothetical protein